MLHVLQPESVLTKELPEGVAQLALKEDPVHAPQPFGPIQALAHDESRNVEADPERIFLNLLHNVVPLVEPPAP